MSGLVQTSSCALTELYELIASVIAAATAVINRVIVLPFRFGKATRQGCPWAKLPSCVLQLDALSWSLVLALHHVDLEDIAGARVDLGL